MRGTWASLLETRTGNDKFSEESAKFSEANGVSFLPFQLFAAEKNAAPEKIAAPEKNAAAVSKWLSYLSLWKIIVTKGRYPGILWGWRVIYLIDRVHLTVLISGQALDAFQ